MQRSGGLTDAHRFDGKDAILSGPAGGIVGMVRTSRMAGFDRVIGFDMGGTSTDVSHFTGRGVADCEHAFETQVAGVRMRAPMMSIHTVAAGGGSILHFDGARLRVRPDSAGANPGPASYRRGGPLAVTDANVTLGKIQPGFFPRVFGAAANESLDVAVVRERFAVLAAEIETVKGVSRSAESVAEGFIDIAIGNMAEAIKRISVARGYDVTQYTLATLVGAGGQHACRVADALGMTTIFVHPLAGVLSAYGMGLADQTAIRSRSLELALSETNLPAIAAALGRLAQEAAGELAAQGLSANRITIVRRVHLRYEGTDSALVVAAAGSVAAMQASFDAHYLKRYSFLMAGRGLVVEAVTVEAVGGGDAPDEAAVTVAPRAIEIGPAARIPMFCDGRWHDTPVFVRADTRPGDVMRGPAIISEATVTTVVAPGWQAVVTARDHLVLTRVEARARPRLISAVSRPRCPTTSTPRKRCAWRRFSMSFEPWSTTRLLSTPAV